jgi:hypothetical protein
MKLCVQWKLCGNQLYGYPRTPSSFFTLFSAYHGSSRSFNPRSNIFFRIIGVETFVVAKRNNPVAIVLALTFAFADTWGNEALVSVGEE